MTRLSFSVAILVSTLCGGVRVRGHRSTSLRSTTILLAMTFTSIRHLRRSRRQPNARSRLQRHDLRQRLRPTAVHRKRPERADDYRITESNNVYALNATSGTVIWQRDLGTPAPTGSPCPGNIIPVGITGTPVVDLASQSLFFDSMVSGNPNKHFMYSLNVDTGGTNADWPVGVNATANYNGIPLISTLQEQRGSL